MRRIIITLALLFIIAACVPLEPAPADNETNETFTSIDDVPEEEGLPEEEPEAIYFTIEAVEGDLITLNPEAIDPDGDRITFSFMEPFSEAGEWQTQLGDEGTYFVQVIAEDGKGGRTTETVQVDLARANRPPIVECQTVKVQEGEYLNLHDYCTISDEDDEEIIVTYGGWMTSWRYQTTYDDAGDHTVLITASSRRNGETLHVVKRNVTVTIVDVNRGPEFGDFPTELSGTENDVIALPTQAIVDPDGDEVHITYSSPFNDEGVWKTGLGDAGKHTVDVVASDGETTVKKTVNIDLALLNTAPTLQEIEDISVDEGTLIELPISATDREGDPLTIDISGWMTTEARQTTYDDAGEYTVKITVTDGAFVSSEIVSITVHDVNRPPVFVIPA